MTESLFPRLAEALAVSEIGKKIALTVAFAADWQAGKLDWQDTTPVTLTCGRPAKPELVPHKQVQQRNPQTPEGRAHLLHAIVHIEFTAINLAIDHAARFRGLPKQYYADWIGVAAEEAEHFQLLRQRLQSLGHDYGDFPAHAFYRARAHPGPYHDLNRTRIWDPIRKTIHHPARIRPPSRYRIAYCV